MLPNDAHVIMFSCIN